MLSGSLQNSENILSDSLAIAYHYNRTVGKKQDVKRKKQRIFPPLSKNANGK
jgi:hypothetical protein